MLWYLLLVVTGCNIKEDLSDCPPADSYQISFRYYAGGSTDIFSRRIESVRTYIFNKKGEYRTQRLSTRSELETFQGITPDLEPGEYEIVCWANVSEWSEFPVNQGSLRSQTLYSSYYLRGEPVQNFDSLYYGRQSITIPEYGTNSDTVLFHSAHIRMAIYIEGLETTPGETAINRAAGDPQGWIVLRNFFVGYDFMRRVTGETDSMYPTLTLTGENILQSKFDLFRFGNENDIEIDFYNGEGKQVYFLRLKDFLRDNNIQAEEVEELTIPIYIRFQGISVEVSVKEWDSEEVNPIV
ncbi:MAG: FimB/Mfa2 family fimbrial subunit [Bacteroides sp.]|nr:FimB/Mfa2 family fimbrial subunit [Bacteroides sp.]